MEQEFRGLGRCTCCFWAAVAFDTVGLSVLLIGVFATVFFYDLLIYAGAIIIFLSLIWWFFWYSGNIEVPVGELDDVGLLKKNRDALTGIGAGVRRFSTRVSSGIRNSFRGKGEASGAHGGRPHRSAGGTQVPPQAEQVVVAMAVMGPLDVSAQSVSSAGDADIRMPPTATESLPT